MVRLKYSLGLTNDLLNWRLRRLNVEPPQPRARLGHPQQRRSPGATHTNLQITGPTLGKTGSNAGLGMRMSRWIPGLWQEVPQGCLPALYAATCPYGPDVFVEMTGMPKLAMLPGKAKNGAAARRLWQVSEQLTGVQFPMD
jgi:hypothetical protein